MNLYLITIRKKDVTWDYYKGYIIASKNLKDLISFQTKIKLEYLNELKEKGITYLIDNFDLSDDCQLWDFPPGSKIKIKKIGKTSFRKTKIIMSDFVT